MKKDKKIDTNTLKSENNNSFRTQTSTLSLSDSILEIDKTKVGNQHFSIESKLLPKNLLKKSDSFCSLSSSGSISTITTCTKNTHQTLLSSTTKTKSPTPKHTTLTIYLLSILFLLQLGLTTVGFFIQFNYLKNQNELFELRMNTFFEQIVADLNANFDAFVAKNQRDRSSFDNYDNTGGGDDEFMILNLTHAIKLNDLNLNQLNRTALKYQQSLFDAVLNENLNSRIKRHVKRASSFYHKADLGGNNTNRRNQRHPNGNDSFWLTDKQPRNVSGDHFLIQAYSKISV